MTPTRTWIVIADGGRAKIFEHNRTGGGFEAVESGMLHAPDDDTREFSDRPGRTFDSAGDNRHAMEPTSDPRREAKADFAKTVVAFLEDARKADRFDRLIIAAAPVTLGDLRNELNDHLKPMVHAEFDKDLTKIPTADLPKHFEDVLAV